MAVKLSPADGMPGSGIEVVITTSGRGTGWKECVEVLINMVHA